MDAYITKPIDVHTMLRLMRSFLSKQEYGGHLSEILEDSTVNDPSIPDIAGLDIPAALNRLDGNVKLYLWVLRTFVKEESNTAIAIEEALIEGNTKLALRNAHTIKSTAGSMGAEKMEELARTLENSIALDEPPERIREALRRFADEEYRLMTEISSHLPVAQETDSYQLSGTVDLAIVTPILNRLLGYIEGRDGKVERYLDDYQREMGGLSEKDLGQLKTHLKNFDFAAARAALLLLSARSGIILSSDDTGEYNS
jgi:HPt (histidine-containing phosphotransfer) domain-containing protein